jgi:hypothetical protein
MAVEEISANSIWSALGGCVDWRTKVKVPEAKAGLVFRRIAIEERK